MDQDSTTRGIDWEDYIEADPEIMVGKPVIKGTRITVELILEFLAGGWSAEQVLESYPDLTPESLRAVFAFAAELVSEQRFFGVPLPARKQEATPGAAIPGR